MERKPQIITRAGHALTMPGQKRLKDRKEKEAWRKRLFRKRDRDRQMVKGTFIYHECPGGFLEFVYRGYPGDPMMKYELFDGQMYEIPLGVAKHLNQNTSYKIHQYQLGPDGNYSQNVGKRVKRFSFQSFEYTDALKEERYEDDDSNVILPTPDHIVQKEG